MAGGGRLLWQLSLEDGTDQFTYDLKDPVPSLHGRGLQVRPTDQRPLAERRDTLVYQTEPLTERFEVTGNATVELHASSSAPDTDFFARLIDVAPDGTARDVAAGMVRAGYRNGLDQPVLLPSGKPSGTRSGWPRRPMHSCRDGMIELRLWHSAAEEDPATVVPAYGITVSRFKFAGLWPNGVTNS